MRRTYNGMAATEIDGVVWQKSRLSNSQGQCVELARLADGDVAVRNSRFPSGPALIYTRADLLPWLVLEREWYDHDVAAVHACFP